MNFKATNIERVVQKVSKDGTSCLYLIEVFIYDKANFFEKKIEIDIHHNINMDYLMSLCSKVNQASSGNFPPKKK